MQRAREEDVPRSGGQTRQPATLASAGSARWLGYFGFALIGWNAVLAPTLIRTLEHEFGQTDAGFALFYFATSLVYACGSFGGGFITERIGRRAVLAAAGLFLAFGLGGQAAALIWPLFLVAALFVNFGAGAIDGGINGLFLNLFPEARGGALNMVHLFFGLGAFVGPFVAGQLTSSGVSWRLLFAATGIGGLALTMACRQITMPSGRHSASTHAHAEAVLTRGERSLVPFSLLAVAIGCYVASEMGVSAWLVKFLVHSPVSTASAVLSGFWAGLALGRLLSRWVAERFDYMSFTAGCSLLFAAALAAAVLAPNLVLSGVLFALAGFFCGPIYPMIMALGGDIYPHRLASLSGALSAAAVVGSLAYPPLIGLMATNVGIGAGLMGAAALGVPAALAVFLAVRTARRPAVASGKPLHSP